MTEVNLQGDFEYAAIRKPMARLTEDVAFFMRLGEREAPDVRTEFQEAARSVRENKDQENKAPEQDRQRPDQGRNDGMDYGR